MASDPLRISGLTPRPSDSPEYPDLFDTALATERAAGVAEGRRLERERILKLRVPFGYPSRTPWYADRLYHTLVPFRDGWNRALRAYRKRIKEVDDGE